MSSTHSSLTDLRRLHSWSGAAWRARWKQPLGAEDVLVVQGPPHSARLAEQPEAAVAMARELRAPGVLSLLDCIAHGHRAAFVYEYFDAVAVLHVIESERPNAAVPARAAAELVARVAEVLAACEPSLRHPGPEAWDVLLDANGVVKVSGFVGPNNRSARLFAPFGDDSSAALVYRLGVYLGTLLAGQPPGQANDERTHNARVRRLLIAAMSRPQVGLPDLLGDALRSMLAWDPDDRPSLRELPERLRTAVAAVPQAGLAAWASRIVPELEQGNASSDTTQREQGPPSLAELDDEDDRTAVDDATMIGLRGSTVPVDDHTLQTHRRAVDQGERPAAAAPDLFPVQVGPPPELVSRRPQLPAGFLIDGVTDPTSVELNGGRDGSPILLVVGLVLLTALVVSVTALAAVFIDELGGDELPEEPTIADALPRPSERGPFELRILVRGGEPFRVVCAGGTQGEGTDEVQLSGVIAGPCELHAQLDGEPVVVPFEATGPATIRCLQTRQARCH